MTRAALGILSLLVWLGSAAAAEAAVTYIDPSCNFDGTGAVSEPCATSGGGAGPRKIWPTVTGAGNEFRQKRGTTYRTQVFVQSGASGNPVLLGNYGTGALPIIRGEQPTDTTGTIYIDTAAHDIVIDGLEIHGQTACNCQTNGIRNNAATTDVVNITVRNSVIKNVVDVNGSANEDDGIDLRGRGLIVENNTFDLIDNDAVWLFSDGAANDMIILDNTCTRVGQTGIGGDCYQTAGTSTGAVIERNTADRTDRDVKYGIVSNSPDSHIRDNTVYGYVGGTVAGGIYCGDGIACWIYRNTVYGGKSAILNYGSGGGTWSNVIIGCETYCVEINAANSFARNNTVIGTKLSILAGIRLTPSATNSVAENNVLANFSTGILLVTGAGHSETHNLFQDVTTPIFDNTTSSGLAATNAITGTGHLADASGRTGGTLVGASSGRRSGKPWQPCSDRRGRTCLSPPDRGAYQHASGGLAPQRAVRP